MNGAAAGLRSLPSHWQGELHGTLAVLVGLVPLVQESPLPVMGMDPLHPRGAPKLVA